jgi:cytochrome d ubiquinol oxidase subunit II
MTLATAVAGLLWLAISAYAVLGGADFGGGFWDLFAGGPRRQRQRDAIAGAMGPVWEANHVWMIFGMVVCFTAFPAVFATLGRLLYVPFTIVLIGIVLRGAAFAFRAHGREAVGEVPVWGPIFGAASILAPAFLGAAAAAIATGRVSPHIHGGIPGWLTPIAIDLGLLAVSLCAYLAATYLMVETEADPELQADFRRRALAAAIVSGALAILALILAYAQWPALWDRLSGQGLPLLLLALVNGPIALIAVLTTHPRIARLAVAGQMLFVLWAWAVGQWPYILPPDYTLSNSAGPDVTLRGLLIIVAVGMVILLPSLFLLFRIFKGRNPAEPEPGSFTLSSRLTTPSS